MDVVQIVGQIANVIRKSIGSEYVLSQIGASKFLMVLQIFLHEILKGDLRG